MKASFDPGEFVRRIGHDLVRAFDDAREATTPELVGDAMEQPVRDRLEQILPRGIAVGSGCVIDIKGGTSRQMDVVLYERNLCPVFCINDSPETTYYPVECVLAVGEIKSTIGKKGISDAFDKIRSVKALHRFYGSPKEDVYIGRRYGEVGSASAHGFYRDHTNKGDIFGFVLAEKSAIAVTLPDHPKTHGSAPKVTLLHHYVKNISKLNNDVLCPDVVVLLDGMLLTPLVAASTRSFTPYIPARAKSVLPHVIHPMYAESPFGELIKQLWQRYQNGLTAHIPLERYLQCNAKIKPNLTWTIFANFDPQANLKPGDPLKVETPTDHLRDDLKQLTRKIV